MKSGLYGVGTEQPFMAKYLSFDPWGGRFSQVCTTDHVYPAEHPKKFIIIVAVLPIDGCDGLMH